MRDKIFSDSQMISSRDGSSGQGLTIVKLFAVMHKGRVEFESDPEKNWTVFRVRLPLQ
jgi:nitrogen-specific signal transduction histidine kinase